MTIGKSIFKGGYTMTLSQVTIFMGWVSVINLGLLFLWFFILTALKGVILPFHSQIFGLSVDDLSRIYFQYMVQFKILVIVFNVVPYIALKIMSR